MFVDLIVNLLAGVIFAVLAWWFNLNRYWRVLHRYDNVNFDIWYKGVNQTKELRCRVATCTVKANVITYKGYQMVSNSRQGSFEGRFVMNPLNLTSGDGVHYHDEFDGFNFPKIIIKDTDTFYIETAFGSKPSNEIPPDKFIAGKNDGNTDKDFIMYYQAYVWKRATEN